jgi:hypothetical protein
MPRQLTIADIIANALDKDYSLKQAKCHNGIPLKLELEAE